MKNILLAGGTGLIGTRLASLLEAKGYSVRLLTRHPNGKNQFLWDPANHTIDESALEGVDAVINLAGAGIADKRWTPGRKQLIIDSRVQSAGLLYDCFRKMGNMPGAYLSASAIGYYGNSGEKMMYETDPPVDHSFMPQCCAAWEESAERIGALGIRTVMLRIGVVMDKGGGALAEFIKPLRFGIAGYFGDGKAWYSWIHRDDVCQMFIWALEHPAVEGIYNAVAPHPVRNKELIQTVARVLHLPSVTMPVPSFALRTLLGEMSAVVLNSNFVCCDKILQEGFRFQYPEIEKALEAMSDK